MNIEGLIPQLKVLYRCHNPSCQNSIHDHRSNATCNCRDYKACIDQLKEIGITQDFQVIRFFASQPNKTVFTKIAERADREKKKQNFFTRFQELHDIYDYLSETNFGSNERTFLQDISGLDLLELQASVARKPLSPVLDFDKTFFGDYALSCGIFNSGTLTEISGRSTSGKTQFCLSLAAYFLVCHLKRADPVFQPDSWLNPVIFIDTSGDFTLDGLSNHLVGLIEIVLKPPNDDHRRVLLKKCLSLISYFKCTNYEKLVSTIAHVEAKQQSSKKSKYYPRLVIVDNIYTLLAHFLQPSKASPQQQYPGQLIITEAIQSLRRLAIELSCPVILTNSVVRRYLNQNELDSSLSLSNIGTEVSQFQSGLGSTLPYLIDFRISVVRLPGFTFEFRLDLSHMQPCPQDHTVEFDPIFGLIMKTAY